MFWFLLPCAVLRASDKDIAFEAALPAQLAQCVSSERLRASYVEMLAAYGGGAQAPALRLRVRDAGVHAGTQLLEASAFSGGRDLGTRTLPVKGSDCDALPNTLALVLVLLATEAAPVATATAPPKPSAAGPPAVAPKPAQHHDIELAAGAQALFGVLPHTAAGLQLRAAIASRPMAVRLAIGLVWPQQLEVAEGAILWRSYEMAIEACSYPLQPLAWLGLRLCAGPRFGVMFARSEGFALQTKGTSAGLLYLGMQPEAAVRLGTKTSLQLGGGIGVALWRPRFYVGLDGGEHMRVFDEPAPVRAELTVSLAQIF